MGDWKKGRRAGERAKSQEVSVKVVAEIDAFGNSG